MSTTILTTLLCICLAGCSLVYETPIGGGYFLVDGDRDHIWISKQVGDQRQVVIDQQIVGILKGVRFVLVHRMIAISYECTDESGKKTIMTKRTDEEEYWIIDTQLGYELGPYDHSAMLDEVNRLQIEDAEGIPKLTAYRSNRDRFESRASRCVELQEI